MVFVIVSQSWFWFASVRSLPRGVEDVGIVGIVVGIVGIVGIAGIAGIAGGRSERTLANPIQAKFS